MAYHSFFLNGEQVADSANFYEAGVIAYQHPEWVWKTDREIQNRSIIDWKYFADVQDQHRDQLVKRNLWVSNTDAIKLLDEFLDADADGQKADFDKINLQRTNI